jgi:O-acetyl-ADP-ribose deacetylase (regulator of RNase III)
MSENAKLIIPDKLKIGFQKREGTYTGKLAFVVYIDSKGVLRKAGVYIFNVATKDDFIADSKYDWIAEAIKSMPKIMRESGIKSVAIPALGCGLGCLDWKVVKQMIVTEATRPVEHKSIVDDQPVVKTVENWHDIEAEVYEPL